MKMYLVDFFASGHHPEYAAHLASYLKEAGHEPTVWSWGPSATLTPVTDRQLPLRFVQIRSDSISQGFLRSLYRIAEGLHTVYAEAETENVEIVHLLYLDNAELPLWWNLAVLHRELAVSTVATLFWPHFVDARGEWRPLRKLMHRITKCALKQTLKGDRLSAVFMHTPHLRDRVLASFRGWDLANRFVVVPDPVYESPVRDASSVEQSRRALGLPQDKVIFLFFGNLSRIKGADLLLDIVDKLPSAAYVTFAGPPSPDLGIDWEKEARSRAGSNNVRIDVGHIPNDMMPSYFEAANAVVLPYRSSFLGTSGVLNQALSARKPVIAANVGEVGRLVAENRLGIVVEPDDTLGLLSGIQRYMVTRETLDSSVRAQAAAYAAANHWRITASIVLETYERHIRARGKTLGGTDSAI